jgi:hypothetical protein
MKCLGEESKIVWSFCNYWHIGIISLLIKFFNGKLAAGDTLRLMEEATQNEPDQMQKGLISFSECSSIGLQFSNFEQFILLWRKQTVECVVGRKIFKAF